MGEDGILTTSWQWRRKRLGYLYDRLRGSLAQRGLRATWHRVAQEFQRRPALDDSLHLLALSEHADGLSLPHCASPRVSIVIPVYGKLAYTLACLRSIANAPSMATIEVIVIDDASPDHSAGVLAGIDGLRLLKNPRNLGFVGSCNAGAAQARGQFLLFLNNDTQVTAGWLDAMLNCFAQEPDCGIVGSRLVYPDGRLQEAGGWVFAEGSGWNIGRFESRHSPAFRYRRRVDYVSGASLLIERQRFVELGGFDQRYAPGYFEDTDLAFAMRTSGRAIYYEPSSLVVHAEGISSGSDPEQGMKRFQAINQSKLRQKWPGLLASHPAPGTPLRQLARRHVRGSILIVDSMTPDPRRDSGSLRLIAILRILHQDGWHTYFAPDDGHASEAQIDALGELGCEMLCKPWTKSLPDWLRQHGAELDAVMLCRHGVAGQYVDLVRRHAPQARLLFDTVDLHFLREQRAAELTGQAAMQRQADASRRNELALIERSDVSFVVSPHEHALLHNLLPQASIAMLSNIHELHGRGAPFAERKDLVFIGGYGHPPNADAIHWMADALLPALRAQWPDIQIHVLGDMPELERASLGRPGLTLHGRVDELAPWLEHCLASLAPLRFGAGVKGKINMAMSYGLPVIATPIAVEGMHLHDGIDVLLAEGPLDFVAAVGRLGQQAQLWERLSLGGQANVERHFSYAAARQSLRQALA